jgi:hypothetical protein
VMFQYSVLGTLLFVINTYSLKQPFVEIFVHFKLPCSLFSKKNPIIQIFNISGYLAVPIYPDTCSYTVFFSFVQPPFSSLDRLIADVSRSHTKTPHLVGFLWMRNRPDAETSI